jgi:hypothetical protein
MIEGQSFYTPSHLLREFLLYIQLLNNLEKCTMRLVDIGALGMARRKGDG